MEIPKYIEVKTSSGQRAAFLSPNDDEDSIKDCFIDCRLNAESTLEFMIPATSEKISELTPECQIWAGGRVYSLLISESSDTTRDDKNRLWAKYMAVERWKNLETSFVEPYITNDPTIPHPADLTVIIVGGGTNLSGGIYPTGSAAHALRAVLQGSGWSLGICDVPGTHDLEMEKDNRLTIIRQIQNLWGGHLVWDSVNKIVHLRDSSQWQNYTGFQVRYKKNLKHITRTQSNRLVTKLYCFGHDDLDISSVNGGVKFLTNNSYTPREYVGVYKNQDIYNAQELKEKGTAELLMNCRPRYKYSVKMVDIRTLPEYSHEDFAVGDLVDVADESVAPETPRVRLYRHKYNVFKPWICELEIGDPVERLVENLKASFETNSFIDNTFKGNGQISGYSIENLTITNAKINDLSANKITAGTINATISITSPTINGGAINGTTITGALLRTSSSGNRLEITTNGLSSYSTGLVKTGISITNDSSIGLGDLQYYHNNTLQGGLQYNTSDAMSLYSRNGKSIDLSSDSDIYLSPKRASGGRIHGILVENHLQPPHNHGIGPGVHIATVDPATGAVNGMVTWSASGGFELTHNIY
ncbi:prophage endopeptidase tail [Ruminiclostridium hungatei]|uniref:Prophage endopeptidase tail n=1 Tax=Ruminiclostridium hungatei TaxID=48256 RepID=A0A1V4SRH1_RUMHU|nr:phage tail protein [Ruminiclostridium hungatei]OPX46383.1 prophage endopeptidase tail [Ruminiclostridium hungatei]